MTSHSLSDSPSLFLSRIILVQTSEFRETKRTMACIINCSYTSITATATPISQDPNLSPSSSSSPSPRQTKVILPKKKPEKWSTGVAPGDYGGPPVATKLRKYWGGEKEDPIIADEYIWNNEFMDRMKRLIEDPNNSSAPQFPPMKVVPNSINSPIIYFSVDLSACLILLS